MDDELNDTDLAMILECLSYYKKNIEEYQGYPNEDFRRLQIQRVETVTHKVRSLRRLLAEQ